MPFGLQTVPLGFATVGRIERAEETDERNGCHWDLITRIPFAVVAPRRDAEAVRLTPRDCRSRCH